MGTLLTGRRMQVVSWQFDFCCCFLVLHCCKHMRLSCALNHLLTYLLIGKKRDSERISLHILHNCIPVCSVINRTSREMWKIKPRRTASSRALTAASVVRCSHKTTTKCLWRARKAFTLARSIFGKLNNYGFVDRVLWQLVPGPISTAEISWAHRCSPAWVNDLQRSRYTPETEVKPPRTQPPWS